MSQVIKKIAAVAGIAALLALGSVVVTAAPASAQADLCDLLGDPYCPDDPQGGSVECPTTIPAGGSGTCTVNGDLGPITAVLVCGDTETVVFQGDVSDGDQFSFSAPEGTPPGTTCFLRVNGLDLPVTVGGVTLARTGSDVGPAVAIGAGLILLGGAAFLASRRRTGTVA